VTIYSESLNIISHELQCDFLFIFKTEDVIHLQSLIAGLSPFPPQISLDLVRNFCSVDSRSPNKKTATH